MKTAKYTLITAARNEEAYIRNTLESVVNQTRLPDVWLIASDGSTDRTDDYVREFAARYDFIRLFRIDNAHERSFSSKSFALNAAYERIGKEAFDYIGFLDADISLPDNYYEELLSRFDDESRLGLAGGAIVENTGQDWELRQTDSLTDVGGQMQLFRRACFEQVGGFPPLRWGGEDTVANIKARHKGWQVRVFTDIRVRHHRRTGTAGASVLRSRFRGGMCDYHVGYHPLFEVVKCMRRVVEPPFVAGSFLRLCGYLWPALSREKRAMPSDFVQYVRQQQLQRMLRAGSHT